MLTVALPALPSLSTLSPLALALLVLVCGGLLVGTTARRGAIVWNLAGLVLVIAATFYVAAYVDATQWATTLGIPILRNS